jgi:hypothetical protein
MQLVCLVGDPTPRSSDTATTCGSVLRCCSNPAGDAPPGLCPVELARCTIYVYTVFCPLALKAVTGQAPEILHHWIGLVVPWPAPG